MNTYRIEYELPPLRAIYSGEVNAENESDARTAFGVAKPGHRIRKIELYDRINIAREAILDELRRRWKDNADRDGVIAPSDISRFYQPQKNYFCGNGVMDCPICKTGKLHYDRSPHNGHVFGCCSGHVGEGCVWWRE